jgi:hypothetical protein
MMSLLFCFVETGSHYVDQAGLEFVNLLPHLLVQGLQM